MKIKDRKYITVEKGVKETEARKMVNKVEENFSKYKKQRQHEITKN